MITSDRFGEERYICPNLALSSPLWMYIFFGKTEHLKKEAKGKHLRTWADRAFFTSGRWRLVANAVQVWCKPHLHRLMIDHRSRSAISAAVLSPTTLSWHVLAPSRMRNEPPSSEKPCCEHKLSMSTSSGTLRAGKGANGTQCCE